MTISVIVADDHPLFLTGVTSLFRTHSSVEIVASAGNCDQLIDTLQKHHCDVLVTDFSMPGGRQQDGLRMISRLVRTWPQLRIVIITMHDNPAVLGAIARLKVAGLVSKSDIAEELVTAVLTVGDERSYLSQHIRQSIGIDMLARLPDKTRLSPREAEVCRLFASGLTGNQIAAQLHRSKKTISRQKVNAFQKLGCQSDSDFFLFINEMKKCENGLDAALGRQDPVSVETQTTSPPMATPAKAAVGCNAPPPMQIGHYRIDKLFG